MWLGFLISVSAQAVFFTFYLYKLNWEKASKEVRNSSTDSHSSHGDVPVHPSSVIVQSGFKTAKLTLPNFSSTGTGQSKSQGC